jgi:hypothetical protein
VEEPIYIKKAKRKAKFYKFIENILYKLLFGLFIYSCIWVYINSPMWKLILTNGIIAFGLCVFGVSLCLGVCYIIYRILRLLIEQIIRLTAHL